MDLDQQSKMTIFESLLTTFEPCVMFWFETAGTVVKIGSNQNQIITKFNQVKLGQIHDMHCSTILHQIHQFFK